MSEKKARRCFVIGPIGSNASPERNHADMFINNIVRHALADFEPPYEVARSDEREDPGMITDHMIHDILSAHLVIADLTFLNPNAFYELGIRHAAEKPVIHFAQYGTKPPFDASPHRAIIEDITTWPGTVRARQRIKDAAKATEVEGYRVSNPITQANATQRLRESADTNEQVIADLLTRVERLEARPTLAERAARNRETIASDAILQDLMEKIARVARAGRSDPGAHSPFSNLGGGDPGVPNPFSDVGGDDPSRARSPFSDVGGNDPGTGAPWAPPPKRPFEGTD